MMRTLLRYRLLKLQFFFFFNFFILMIEKKKRKKKGHFCISAEICILASIGRNGLERIGMDRNLGQDGMGGFLSRFAY